MKSTYKINELIFCRNRQGKMWPGKILKVLKDSHRFEVKFCNFKDTIITDGKQIQQFTEERAKKFDDGSKKYALALKRADNIAKSPFKDEEVELVPKRQEDDFNNDCKEQEDQEREGTIAKSQAEFLFNCEPNIFFKKMQEGADIEIIFHPETAKHKVVKEKQAKEAFFSAVEIYLHQLLNLSNSSLKVQIQNKLKLLLKLRVFEPEDFMTTKIFHLCSKYQKIVQCENQKHRNDSFVKFLREFVENGWKIMEAELDDFTLERNMYENEEKMKIEFGVE